MSNNPKDLLVKIIRERRASDFVCEHHYSHKCAVNPQVNFGIFWNGKLSGVAQFGPSLDKRKLIKLVADTRWNEFIELNRLVFSDELPRNSESRALSVMFRMFRKNWPHLKWVISFADGTQCGDGTIYRASGFVLTGIVKNIALYELPDGRKIHKLIIEKTNQSLIRTELRSKTGLWKATSSEILAASGAKRLFGFQLRYIYFLNKSCREKLTVPEIPFSRIAKIGATMYKGKRPCVQNIESDVPSNQKERAVQFRPERSNETL